MTEYVGFTAAEWQEVSEEIGARLRERREALGFSVATVATMAELDPDEYARWEDGGAAGPRVNPFLRDFIRVTICLGLALTDVFDMEELRPIEVWPDTMTAHGFLEDEKDIFRDTVPVTNEWWSVYSMALGARFRIRRFRLRVSMAALSEMTGLDKEYISHIETGRASSNQESQVGSMPSILTIATMARALRTSLVDLLPINPRVYDELDRRPPK
ncbi:hypothetical protein GCM10025867_50250 (plasmid) [Frondihabitans sucicola]|uniref:HTH cro/C1-type domain-containing protein n=1 Tax=Frondihabitans sucicola TaxID=1268041 RepID=A0ABN6Y647_9MICO|nr:helix-turn-helix transcriptional regulator [Frondihabitans sucicola]BDZ52784.1 hypothetical protein GCM10025867_50250 [Frondihabitans sucicola]